MLFSNGHLSGDPTANKVLLRHHLKINEIQAFSKSIARLVYSTLCMCMCVRACVRACVCVGVNLRS